VPEQVDFTPDAFDSHLQMELALLSQGSDDQPQYGKAAKRLLRTRTVDQLALVMTIQPLLDTSRVYKVEFPDNLFPMEMAEYASANKI
jgi:hypothetical protein